MDFNGQDDFDLNNDFSNLVPDRAELEAEEMFAQADRLLNEGVILDVVEKLTQILRRNPRFGKAYNHLGWVYEMKYKNMERAEEYYKAAMRYAPNYNATYLNYAYFLSNLSRFEELKTHLDKVSQLPGIARDTIANEYAIMYEMQGSLEEAIDHYHKAAMTTLDNAKLDRYRESIGRCHKKMELLSPSSSFLS